MKQHRAADTVAAGDIGGILASQQTVFRPIGDVAAWQAAFDSYWQLLKP